VRSSRQDVLPLCDDGTAAAFERGFLGEHSTALLEAAGGSMRRAPLADAATGPLASWAGTFFTLHVSRDKALLCPSTLHLHTSGRDRLGCWGAALLVLMWLEMLQLSTVLAAIHSCRAARCTKCLENGLLAPPSRSSGEPARLCTAKL
jgi:hypothetical protein